MRAVLANRQLDVQAHRAQRRSIGWPLPSKGRGGAVRVLFRRTYLGALEPLTSSLLPLSKRRGDRTRNMIKPEMHHRTHIEDDVVLHPEGLIHFLDLVSAFHFAFNQKMTINEHYPQ